MYKFLLIIYMFVSIILIFLILLQFKLGINNANDFRNTILGQIEKSNSNSNILNNFIIFFSFIFFIINLILCNINF